MTGVCRALCEGKAGRAYYSAAGRQGCSWQKRRQKLCRVGRVPSLPGGRVALFSQIRDSANVVESFVRHYASLGFFRLLLYLDDPNDVSRQILEESGWVESGFVELVTVDASLRAAWKSMPSWGRVGQFAEMEVQSRQILNNEHALQRARQLGADWLLHVDSDELLCLPEMAPAFFASLDARGCIMYTFNNVEGVPEEADSSDVLQTVRVFRQNMGLVPRNPAAGMAFFRWQLRLGGWFISYENGKSAVSVKHAVKCLSVCMWEVSPQLEAGCWKEPDGSTCTWFTNNDHLWQAAVSRRKEGRLAEEEEVPRLDKCRGAVLLHFCVCDFAAFWRKRWTQLGYLSASDQFRVRASSGAMMARFYRLQCEGRQAEARELFEAMCVCKDAKAVEEDVKVGILIRTDPTYMAGVPSAAWLPSPRQVPYEKLALEAEAHGAHFDAWLLLGKASEVAGAETASCLSRRASCALAADLAASAAADASRAAALGEVSAYEPLVRALAALGRRTEALAAAAEGKERLAASSLPSTLEALIIDLQQETSQACLQRGLQLPSPQELQQFVARAVRPDGKESRLYAATLAIAIGWWQEVGGDEKEFANALGRAAIAARRELAALDASVRPIPLRRIRQLWDSHEAELKASGVLAMDLEDAPGLWASLAAFCKEALGSSQETTTLRCNEDGHKLGVVWAIFSALSAEVLRSFHLRDLQVLSELRVSRCTAKGPQVDNGGLLPDNRRELSLCLFVLDGSAPDAAIMLRTKDRELSLSHSLQAGRVFAWWSRQTFYQVLGGTGYFAIQCWAVVLQRPDLRACAEQRDEKRR